MYFVQMECDSNIDIYYPTLLWRVQITRETSTNITRYLYSSHSPDHAKDQKPWKVRILGKRKRWIINLLLDILVCSIAVNFYSSFVFWLNTAILHTKTSKKIYIIYLNCFSCFLLFFELSKKKFSTVFMLYQEKSLWE